MPSEFLFKLSWSHFNKIWHDESHPLLDWLVFNKNRTSSCMLYVFLPKKCRTEKRSHSFSSFLQAILITVLCLRHWLTIFSHNFTNEISLPDFTELNNIFYRLNSSMQNVNKNQLKKTAVISLIYGSFFSK